MILSNKIEGIGKDERLFPDEESPFFQTEVRTGRRKFLEREFRRKAE